MNTTTKLAILGCGKLSGVVVHALNSGLLPDYRLVGLLSRSRNSAEKMAQQLRGGNSDCRVCENQEELFSLNPDYIIEAASPAAMKNIALPALRRGISIISLSIGALADRVFYEEVHRTAAENNAKVHLVSGAIGGFDVLRTASLMGPCTTSITTEKGPDSLKGTEVYSDSLQKEKRRVFSGNAVQAIELFPTKVNVAVAASLASVGPEQMEVSVTSTPEYVGDDHRIEISNSQVRAVIDVYSETAEIAGWSIVNTLRNLASPIVF
ncbi:aspartate dehydrogenase domain-containing protein [Marispirochaeta aestuarii]|uniref:aspartate dehydrogenase domain-containing protein n=1 Tax=Marispirochaeta aestuarii TaxID=1963862 RepID=UPI0029C62E1B|nr:aspartate dehydrogenase domain-containing protein [Marispirochaeta aestuarii]